MKQPLRYLLIALIDAILPEKTEPTPEPPKTKQQPQQLDWEALRAVNRLERRARRGKMPVWERPYKSL